MPAVLWILHNRQVPGRLSAADKGACPGHIRKRRKNYGKKNCCHRRSAAGPKAAAKARRIDENAEIFIIQKAPDLSMASCGYPYYVGGVFDDRNMLLCTPTGVVRNPMFFMNAKNIVARTGTEAVSINRRKNSAVQRSANRRNR